MSMNSFIGILPIPNLEFLRLKANFQISPCPLPWSSCGEEGDMPLPYHIIGWSEWVVILVWSKTLCTSQHSLLCGLQDWFWWEQLETAYPLGGPVPYNSIGTINQNYSLSCAAIIHWIRSCFSVHSLRCSHKGLSDLVLLLGSESS